MRLQSISALGLLAFAVVVHGGCGDTACPPGMIGPFDNRDRKAFPTKDADWLCFTLPEPPPPPTLPDLGGFKPADPPGPRDRDAVARAAVFVESCAPIFRSDASAINAHIDATYSAIPYDNYERAILERVNCFKEKTNGCDAVRECLGFVAVFGDPGIAPGCKDGIGMSHDDIDNGWTYWTNCAGLGLECYEEWGFFCGPSRSSCDPELDVSTCIAGESPRNCTSAYKGGPTFAYDEGNCADFGVTCKADAFEASCTGLGPACEETFDDYSNGYFVDYRAGIACENEFTLRACVNGHEQLVDCAAQGEGFRCIGGLRPRCGYDFQCEQVDWHIIPDIHFLAATCEGTSITLCNSGVWTTIDCKSLGFETCDPKRGVCTGNASGSQ